MIPYLSAEHLASVHATHVGTGHAWAAVVHSPNGSRTASGTLPAATEGEALFTAFDAALGLLPPKADAYVILPSATNAPFDLVAKVAAAIASRPGRTECYPDARHLGDAAAPLAEAARSLAEATAQGDGHH